MKRIAAGILGQRMQQQAALPWVAGFDQFPRVLKIAPGLLLGPGSIRAERLEMKQRLVAIERVAVVAARGALAILHKDRLDALHEELKIERIGRHPQSQRQ